MTPPPQRRPARTLLAAALTALALAGCDTGPSDDVEAAGKNNGPAALDNPTPTPSPTPSPTADQDAEDEGDSEIPEAGEPPPLDGLHSNDELEVARTSERYWAWLMEHPNTDPELLKEIVRPDTDIYESLHRLVAHYQEEGLWWTGEGTNEVIDVEVLNAEVPYIRLVRIYYHRDTAGQLVDAEGVVHDEVEPKRRWVEEQWSREEEQDPWRLDAIVDEGTWEEGER